MTITGGRASLTWGYHTAAGLRDWTLVKAESGWTLTASLGQTDTFRVSQRPLKFVVIDAAGAVRWPIETLQIAGASLTAVLGPRER